MSVRPHGSCRYKLYRDETPPRFGSILGMSDGRATVALTTPTNTSGLARIALRTVERCERCGAERAWGGVAACRCLMPAWRAFCTRCARGFGQALTAGDPKADHPVEIDASRGAAEQGATPLCPSCVEIATVNGAKLRRVLESRLTPLAPMPNDGAFAALWARIEGRGRDALVQFGIDAALPALPDWAARLADKLQPLPPGADSSRAKRDAVTALRVEDAGVRLALDRLGYLGRPVEEKLARAIESGSAAAAALASWDGLAASAEHEHELLEASQAVLVASQSIRTLVDSVRTRDLGPLVEASVRRQRAVEGCRLALGVG